MKQLIAIILLACCSSLTSQAQSVGHGADIDAQIAGKQVQKQNKTSGESKKQTAEQRQKPEPPATTSQGAGEDMKMVLRKIKVRKKTPEEMAAMTKVTTGVRHEQGFRIQVYSGGNTRIARQEAERAGQKVKAELPSQPVYVHFYSPRWSCRVGNFKTYNSALPVLRKIRKLGYKGAIIIRAIITVKEVKYVDEY